MLGLFSGELIFGGAYFWVSLFSGKLIFGGAYYWKEIGVSKWVGLDNTNNLRQLTTANTDSLWANIREGLLSERFLHLRFGGLIFGRANFLFIYLFIYLLTYLLTYLFIYLLIYLFIYLFSLCMCSVKMHKLLKKA